MALAYAHVRILLDLKKNGLFDIAEPSMMELGEQNWYGDLHYSEIAHIPQVLGRPPEAMEDAKKQIAEIVANGPTPTEASFHLAKLFYKLTFNYKRYEAIDLHGTPAALKHDLNQALSGREKFDIVTNIGTAEHVFNQYMFFKNMHDLTSENGYMIHCLPNQGGYDHGFFNYHPTFIFDLAHANHYRLFPLIFIDATKKPPEFVHIQNRETYIRMAIDNKLSPYSGLFAVFKKSATPSEFQIPMQGYYDNQLPEELRAAWSKMDR